MEREMKHVVFGITALLATITAGAATMAEQTIGPETYEVGKVYVDNFLGTINIAVTSGDKVSVRIVGEEEYMEDLEIRVSDGDLYIGRDDPDHDWFERIFGHRSHRASHNIDRYPVAEISVPEGMALDLDGIAGRLEIGDLNGPLELSGWWLEGSIGKVTEAEISILGSGKLIISHVVGELDLNVRGSGDVEVGQVGSADISSLGSGDVTINEIESDLDYSGKGSGRGTFGSVNGRVDLSLMGSGDIDIEDGRADPLDISIMGSADVTFGGTAYNSSISQFGSGRVRIAHDNWTE